MGEAVTEIEIRLAKADAWDESLKAVAWTVNQGNVIDAIGYARYNNPYRRPVEADRS